MEALIWIFFSKSNFYGNDEWKKLSNVFQVSEDSWFQHSICICHMTAAFYLNRYTWKHQLLEIFCDFPISLLFLFIFFFVILIIKLGNLALACLRLHWFDITYGFIHFIIILYKKNEFNNYPTRNTNCVYHSVRQYWPRLLFSSILSIFNPILFIKHFLC